jgi:hypothetical protein
MYALLESERILFIFGIQEFIHLRSLPDEYEHYSPRNGHASDGPKTKWDFFFRMSNDLDASLNNIVFIVGRMPFSRM